jgi:hypothetical protein
MTCILHRDPDRRCKPLHEWPEVDRLSWLAALVPGDLFEEGGSRARFTDDTNLGLFIPMAAGCNGSTDTARWHRSTRRVIG